MYSFIYNFCNKFHLSYEYKRDSCGSVPKNIIWLCDIIPLCDEINIYDNTNIFKLIMCIRNGRVIWNDEKLSDWMKK
ncbi:hypothetical protein CBE01nite_41660 [Clostridium beijerinckii]|nr:hypothetical protein CBE01nite_41660 [Clostridium beijerinckii]